MGKVRIIERIDIILKHIDIVENDIKNMSYEDFCKSDLYVRATCFSIAQIGEQMIKLEETLRPNYDYLPWKSIRDMRNIIVHVYNHVNAEVVYLTAKNDLRELKKNLLLVKEDYQRKQQ